MLSSAPVDLDNNPTVLLVRKHLVEHLGPPQDVYEVSGSPLPGSPIAALNLAYFAPGGPEAPVVFATCGASQFRMNDGRRVEALVILQREPPDAHMEPIRRLLASFALFPEANDEAVRLGDVVRARDELAAFCRMDAILFVPPFTLVPSFHRIGLNDDEGIDLVWLLPVYAAEAEYALQHGPQTLMMLLAGERLDLTDPHRRPADCSRSPAEAADLAQKLTEEAPPAPAPRSRRPAASSPRPAPTNQPTGAITVERRAPKTAPAPSPARPAARRPVVRAKPVDEDVRFDLSKDGVPSAARPTRTRRTGTTEPAPKKSEPARTLSKAERVAALKKAALEARARAKAREEGAFSEANPAPGSSAPPPGSAAPQRPHPVRRGGPTVVSPGRPASRRRGAPFQRPGRLDEADEDE